MIPGLRNYLLELKNAAQPGQIYVLPDHAGKYEKNACGISYRVKQFLEKIGIETTRKVSGRYRCVSVKDCHSLRHTFAYIAGVFNIPLVIVQSILGHMTPEMTKHYQRHADNRAKAAALAAMPDFIAINKADTKLLVMDARDEIKHLLSTATDAQVNKVLAFMKENMSF